jgi:putative membrane protein
MRLDEAGRRRIEAAVGDAERATSGEIVVVVATRASRYRSVHLTLALAAGLAAPWPLLALTELSAARILALQALVALAALVLGGFLGDRLVPEAVRRGRAREAAARAFWTRGLDRTRGRTGVLIYVSAAERYVDVVADRGISERVPEAAWRAVVADLAEALHGDDAAGALAAGVAAVGAILADHAPPGAEGDELPNAVVIG